MQKIILVTKVQIKNYKSVEVERSVEFSTKCRKVWRFHKSVDVQKVDNNSKKCGNVLRFQKSLEKCRVVSENNSVKDKKIVQQLQTTVM